MGALVLECRDNDLEITHRARQAVDARDHQRLVGMDEIEDGPEFRTSREGGAVSGRSRCATMVQPCTASSAADLGIEVLVYRAAVETELA